MTPNGNEQPLFRGDTKRVVVEVDAMPGARVHFRRLPSGLPPWEITRANLARIFGPNVPEVVVPHGWPDVGALESDLLRFDADDLRALSERNRQPSRPGEVRFHVLFVRGTFVDHGELRSDIAAVHVAGTHVLAVFDRGPTENPTENPTSELAAVVQQQTTVLHELGHALGLVDLDTPALSEHLKRRDPSHCSHRDCVMHGSNALPGHLDRLLDTTIPTPDALVLFGTACLEDLDERRRLETGEAANAQGPTETHTEPR